MILTHDGTGVEVAGLKSRRNALVVPVLPHRYIKAWPRNAHAERVDYLPLIEVLTRDFETDALLATYSLPEKPFRLDAGAVGRVPVPMAMTVFDVDDEEAHAQERSSTTSWFRKLARRVEALFSMCAGFCARTRRGARLFFRRSRTILVDDVDVRALRLSFYHDACFLARMGIRVDLAACDWQRLHRVPHGTRDPRIGVERLPTIGDPEEVGLWAPSRTETDQESDAAFAAKLAKVRPEWRAAASALGRSKKDGRRRAHSSVERARASLSGRYARAALRLAALEVASATRGRNVRLNDQAFALARFVESAVLSRREVRTTLLRAASAAGLSEIEASRTIESALRARCTDDRS